MKLPWRRSDNRSLIFNVDGSGAEIRIATHEADRAVEARKAEAHERAEAAIPTPDVTQPAAVVVGEIDDAFRGTLPRVVDAETQRRAAERVRARIAAPRRKG